MKFLTSGYQHDLGKLVNGAIFEVQYDEMVIVKDIEFFSMCEHHMLPFYGKAHVGYLARNKVIGLSKTAADCRCLRAPAADSGAAYAGIAHCILDMLDPLGVGVILEAQHFCMMMRGVEKQHSGTVTSAMLGDFLSRKKPATSFSR